ncbi:MAG: tetratricopeptide repeat protein [Pirellula sp.]
MSVLLLVLTILVSGCSSLTPWNFRSSMKPKASSKEKSSSLFSSKPNTRQAQLDLAIVAAEQHEAKQEYREAMKKYQEVLELDKKNSLAHHRIALLACRISATKQAQEHFESALRLAPKDTDLLADYAYWLYLSNQTAQATEMVEKGLKLSPESERLHGIHGLLFTRDRKMEQAVQSFVQSGCTAQQAWANVGHVLILEGDVQAASYWIEHAAQGEGGSATAKRTQEVLQASYNSTNENVR